MAKRPSKDIEEDDRLQPRENPDLLGQGAAERALLDAWVSGKLHHGWLIAGPPGIGKATLAYRFARFVLREGVAPTGAGAGLFGTTVPDNLHVGSDDPVFRRVAASGHADLMTIERQFNDKTGRLKTEIGVDQIRAIAGFLHLTAAEGGWRVVIIDALDSLNPNGPCAGRGAGDHPVALPAAPPAGTRAVRARPVACAALP